MKHKYIACLVLFGLLLAGCSTQSPAAQPTATPDATAELAATTAPAEAATPSPAASPEAVATTTPAPTPTPAPSYPAELGVAELEFVVEGQSITLNTDIQPLLDILGDEYDLSESASKLYSGTIRLYDFGDILLTTYPLDGKDALGEVEFTGEDYQTRRGIMIGDSPDMVKQAYGEDYTGGDEAMTYLLASGASESKTPRIIFEVVDDIVVSIHMVGTAEIR